MGVLDQFGLLGYFRAFVNGSAHFLVYKKCEPIFFSLFSLPSVFRAYIGIEGCIFVVCPEKKLFPLPGLEPGSLG